MVVSEAMRIWPASGSSRPASMRRSVVFPAPFGPERPMRSRFFTCQETSSRRTRPPYRFERPSTWIMGSGDDLQEVQAGFLKHRAVLGVEEAQAVLVDDLYFQPVPFLPAPGADGSEHLLLDRGTEGDAVGGRGLADLSAARAREGHFLLRQTHHSTLTCRDLRGGSRGRDNGGSWKSRSRTEASPPSTSRPRPWPASRPWATRPPPTSSSRPSRGPSAARTWWCS